MYSISWPIREPGLQATPHMDEDIQIPEALDRLLAELEAPSPSIQKLKVDVGGDEFGGFFKSRTTSFWGDAEVARGRVRLRVLRAIGNCASLKLIRLNPSWKEGVYSVTAVEAMALLEALQQSNHVLDYLDVYGWEGFGTAASCMALADLVRSSHTLSFLELGYVGLTSEGLSHIAVALRAPHHCSLRLLSVSGNRVGRGGDGAQHLADIIAHTPTLDTLGMWHIGMDVAGGEIIANALAKNHSLEEELSIGWWAEDATANQSAALATILRALTPSVTNTRGRLDNSSIHTPHFRPNLKTLRLLVEGRGKGRISPELGEALAHMLSSNNSIRELVISTSFLGHGLAALADSTRVVRLGLRNHALGKDAWGKDDVTKLTSFVFSCKQQLQYLEFLTDFPHNVKRQVFGCLKDNVSIKYLAIDEWEDLDDYMFEDLLKSLQANTSMETISMRGTAWDNQGKTAIVNELLRKQLRQVAYLDRLHHGDMKFYQPKVRRLFMCGSAFAGKTTLKTTLLSYEFKSQSSFYKRLFHFKPRRTEGIEIEMFLDSDTMQVSIWDLAGQDEYRALQSLLFPSINQACIFFFVFSRYCHETSTLKLEKDLVNELEHWLRFIASNISLGSDVIPQVVVILTHLDKMPRGTTADVMVEWAIPTVTNFKARYSGLLDISPNVLVVDSTSLPSIIPVRNVVINLFHELFGKLKLVPEACTCMSAVLAKWRSRNSKWPIMRLSKFNELCFESVKQLRKFHKQDEQAVSILQAIAAYLHDVGVIMYFQKLGIVVVDPNWISHVFLGRLMRFEERPDASISTIFPSSSDGFVPEVALQTTLRCFLNSKKHQGFDENDMIDLMLELRLCYRERNPGARRVIRYFVPSSLIDVTSKTLHSLRQLEWPVRKDGFAFRHVGRRLQCKDKLRTYLDPGFFPRLQVTLQGRLFAERREMSHEQYKNELNLITFYTDGIEVLIEMPGDVGDFIDILVRSRKSAEHTRAFVVVHVLDEIRSFCASSEGSQGVELVESIIRPDCVTNLTRCIRRRDQAVLKSELMDHLLGEHVSNKGTSCGQIFRSLEHLDYHHTWSKADGAGLPAQTQRADDLLDPEDMFEVLNKKERGVQEQLTMVEEAAKHVLREAHGGDSAGTGVIRVPRNRRGTSVGHTLTDLGSYHRTSANFHRLHLDNQQIKHPLDRVDEKLDVIMSLQQQMVGKLQSRTLLQEATLVALSSKMDDILRFSAELVKSEVPRRPYFTTDDVGTSQKLVAGIQFCKAVSLHFMCEDPQGNHMVAGQVGLPLTKEVVKWNWIRPIALQSAKVMVFLVKAGLHVAAGIGSVVPDYAEWTGSAPLSPAALVAESLLDSINLQYTGSSLSVEEAWVFLKEELKPQLLAGRMGKLFQLYKVKIVGVISEEWLGCAKSACLGVDRKELPILCDNTETWFCSSKQTHASVSQHACMCSS